jgi:hypothetical protein
MYQRLGGSVALKSKYWFSCGEICFAGNDAFQPQNVPRSPRFSERETSIENGTWSTALELQLERHENVGNTHSEQKKRHWLKIEFSIP